MPRTVAARRFWGWLVAIAVTGSIARVLYVFHVVRGRPLGADAVWYQLQASFIRDGTGYVDPSSVFNGAGAIPTATFPPLYPALLSVAAHVTGAADPTELRLVGLASCAVTVVLTAVLARRVLHDDRIALLAAGLVALSPLVIATDMSLMSEVASVPLTLVALLLAHRLGERRRPVDLALLGTVLGLGALARMDVLVVGALAIVLVLREVGVRWHAVTGSLLAVLAVAAVVVSPWVVRNQRQVGVATLSTTSMSTAIAGANCDATYAGRRLGGWEFTCIASDERTPFNERGYSDEILRRGVRYALDHETRLPVVVGARAVGVWGLWDPVELSEREAVESRRYGWQLLGWASGVVVVGLALAGIWTLRRERQRIAVLIAPLLSVTAIAVVTYASQRFRAPAEPALAILAAAAITRIRRPAPTRGSRRS